MVRKVRSTKLLIILISLLMVLSACSSGSNSGSSSSSGSGSDSGSSNAQTNNQTQNNNTDAASEQEPPLELFLMYNFDGVEFPEENNIVQQKLEELTNTKLTVHALPGPAFEERLPVMIASGDMPDAVPIPRRHQKLPYVIQAVQDGLFWEIGPYLDQFPNLSMINSKIYDNIAYDGKTYGIPRVRPMARRAYQYRADWLENLGMEEPKTVDQYYEMLRAFTFDDPDQNGQDDTYGLVMMQGQPLANYHAPFFGAPNNWMVTEDGEFIKDVMTDEYLEALKFTKRLYDEGIMNRDFAIIDRPEWTAAVEEGRAGVRIDVTGSTIGIDENVKVHEGENARFSMFSILEHGHGKRIFMEGGHNGFWLFPKSSIKDEEHLLRVLKFFDDFAGEEVANYLTWGVEGEHHEVVDGVARRLPAYDEGFGDMAGAYSAPIATLPLSVNAKPGEKKPLEILDEQLNAENEKYMVADPTLPLVSETYLEVGAQIDTILKDADVKFVMGEIDEEGWKNEVQKWRERGGDKIAQEYAEAYKRALQ